MLYVYMIDAFDVSLLCKTIKKLKQGQPVAVPVYDFRTHSRLTDEVMMYGANVIIFEVCLQGN